MLRVSTCWQCQRQIPVFGKIGSFYIGGGSEISVSGMIIIEANHFRHPDMWIRRQHVQEALTYLITVEAHLFAQSFVSKGHLGNESDRSYT